MKNRVVRVIQLVLIALGFLLLLGAIGDFFGSGADQSFTYSCREGGQCVGQTGTTPSGFQSAMVFGLAGLSLEVAAVALGIWAQLGQGTAATATPITTPAAPGPMAQPFPAPPAQPSATSAVGQAPVGQAPVGQQYPPAPGPQGSGQPPYGQGYPAPPSHSG
ncbi:MAG: hypothetical protein ACRDT6_09945 [Micromonosporaceae bacterium]